MDATKYNQVLNYILSEKFTIEGEKLFFVGKGKKAQVIIDEELAKHILNKLHSSLIGGPSGTNETKKSIGSCFYWPGMTGIEQWGMTAPNRNEHEGTDRFYLTKKEGT